MKKILLPILLCLSFVSKGQLYKSESPFAHTYSIVAIDPISGDLAVSVQSHWFDVGNVVSWAEAGVGVVATQSFVNKSFGIRGLELLKEGKTPQEALDILLETDEGREVRQVSILDRNGDIATHTGTKCIKYAGHIIGDDYSVQANMMLNDQVWPEMAAAFRLNNELPLPERMVAVLKAAQKAGGDIRGKQSAALIVVSGEKPENEWDEPKIRLTVHDHKKPVEELDRLLKVYRAYEHMNNGDLALEKGQMREAMEEYGAAQKIFPDNLEMAYWTGITLINNGQLEKGKKVLRRVFAKDENWKELTSRLPEVDLLNVEDKVLKQILDL